MGEILAKNEGIKHKFAFTWLTNFFCNYRCPYCFFDGKWDEVLKRDRHLPKEIMLSAWSRIKDKYGEVKIDISGGEPSQFPGFFNLIKGISNIHSIGISTNLSFDIQALIDNCDPTRISLGASFHPYSSKLEDILDKVSLLRKHGWSVGICCVGYPPFILKLDYYYSYLKDFGFSVLPFWGKYNDKVYPKEYTEEEKFMINKYISKRNNENFKVDPPRVKTRICRAGQVYAHIMPDGEVLRCGWEGGTIYKNFFDGNFTFLDKPLPCNSEYCGCLEWVICD